jgi:hypothetical protein
MPTLFGFVTAMIHDVSFHDEIHVGECSYY